MRAIWIALCSLSLIALVGWLSATAQAGDYFANANTTTAATTYDATSTADLVYQLRAEVAALQARLDNSVAGASCDSCVDMCSDPCCRSAGFIGGAELVFLQPFSSAGTGISTTALAANADLDAFTTTAGAPAAVGTIDLLNFPVDPNFATTGRFWIGYQGCGGLGVRARYWSFDDTTTAGGTIPAGANAGFGLVTGVVTTVQAFHGWDTDVFDAEIFDSSQLGCNWDVTWSFGYRHVDYTENRGFTALTGAMPFDIALQKDFDGDGLTAGLELRRAVGASWGVFANARGSVLFGDERNALDVAIDGISGTPTLDNDNVVKSIFETQGGAEWLRPTDSGALLFARSGVEAQIWDGFGVADSLGDDEWIGFFGFFASVGISR